MNSMSYSLESLGRIACFAAIELDHLGKNEETSFEHIAMFSHFLEGNFSVTPHMAAYFSEPMSSYAVTSAFCDLEKAGQPMDAIFSKIRKELINPLQEIVQMSKQGKSAPCKKEEIDRLTKFCLDISATCTSVDAENCELEEELCW